METVLFYSSSNDQPIFPYKSQIGRTPPKIDMNPPPLRTFISRPSENFSSHHFQSFSSPPQQPPLLPLPLPHTRIPNSNSHSPRVRVKGLSRSRQQTTNIKNNRTRTRNDDSVTPRKSKPLPTSPNNLKPTKELSDQVAKITSTASVSGTSDDIKWIEDVVEVNDFSGSMAFTLSPPPSSLPLPTFSLRPKLGCNVEAAGFDAGATDKICHLLRLK